MNCSQSSTLIISPADRVMHIFWMVTLPSACEGTQTLPDGQSLASGFPVGLCCIKTSVSRVLGYCHSVDSILYWSHSLIKHVSLKMQFPAHQQQAGALCSRHTTERLIWAFHHGCKHTPHTLIWCRSEPAGHKKATSALHKYTHMQYMSSAEITARRVQWCNSRWNLH